MDLHLSLLLLLLLLCSRGWSEHRALRPRSLRVPASSKFRMAVLADLHYGENAWTDWGPAQDSKSDAVISAVLDAESPDLVIYLGDVITANNIPIANASLYWDRALSHARTRGIPLASVFGNHDDMPFEWPSEWFSSAGIPPVLCPTGNSSGEGCSFKGTTRLELMSNELEHYALSFSKGGPKDLWPSISNYVLQVTSSDCKNTPVAFLYFLDSGGGSYPEVISRTQAIWFQTLSEKINPQSRIPEIMFWHIPSLAYKKIAPSRLADIREPCIGSLNEEAVAPQEAEWGIMDMISGRHSIKAVFVGHNHGLDWCCPSDSLWLCFACHSGYGGYGDWPRGSRIIEFTEDPFSLRTWIRMEDGSTHSHVDLTS